MVPSLAMEKFTSEPLLLPSCEIDEVLLGAATCVSTGLAGLSTFQLNVMSEAPSANPVMGIAVRLAKLTGVVGTGIVSPAANAVAPALIVRSIAPEANGVPTVAVPSAPETEPTTENCVALTAVSVMVSATVDAVAPRPDIVPVPTLVAP